MNFKDLKNYFNKILVFYLPGKAGYWNSITPCSITKKPEELGKYYLDFISKINYPGEFSPEGIPLFRYQRNSAIEHPTVIAQYAFGLYELLWQSNFLDEELKNKFIKMADWFIAKKADVKGGSGWFIHIDYLPEYKLPNPWISAMTQGEAISVLTRAAKLTGNFNYESLAASALGPFNYDVKDGGLVNYFKNIPIYEECPIPHKPMAVLNGFIFSLLGFYDLILLNNSDKASYLFGKGTKSLKMILPYFDLSYWSQYYLFDYPKIYLSSFTYHNLVTEQLKVMYFITGVEEFKKYYLKWEKCSKSLVKKTKALYNKLMHSNKFISG